MPSTQTIKITIVGKFTNLHDEEYIARSFEALGYDVTRVPEHNVIFNHRPDVLLYSKWNCPPTLRPQVEAFRRAGTKTVAWLFDLYYGYQREHLINKAWYFQSDYVFTTDGGKHPWKAKLLRQGIYDKECVLLPFEPLEYDVVFVGSDNPLFPERKKLVQELEKEFKVKWFGRKNTNELRGMELNKLYAKTAVVIGDSYPSPHYWSNRVVETLGRGGCLIHKETEGLKEAYPGLLTYSNIEELKKLIKGILEHETLRREIVQRNYEWVKDNYLATKQCQRLLNSIL